jgi:hypothetical protein
MKTLRRSLIDVLSTLPIILFFQDRHQQLQIAGIIHLLSRHYDAAPQISVCRPGSLKSRHEDMLDESICHAKKREIVKKFASNKGN